MDRLASSLLLLALGCRAQTTAPATTAEPIAASQAEASATGPSTVEASPPVAAQAGASATEPSTVEASPPVAASTAAATPVTARAEPPGTAPGVAAAPPVAATPAQPLQASATWPFHAWDRAEAIRFNHVRHGPGIALRAYDGERGWSEQIVERRPISLAQAEQAVQWTIATGGEVEVSKCAFPRHAVVLYSGETPVGSVNVCFECGDILVWPDLDRRPDHANMKPGDAKRFERRLEQKLRAYKKVFPRWEKLFRDELGWPLDPL